MKACNPLPTKAVVLCISMKMCSAPRAYVWRLMGTDPEGPFCIAKVPKNPI